MVKKPKEYVPACPLARGLHPTAKRYLLLALHWAWTPVHFHGNPLLAFLLCNPSCALSGRNVPNPTSEHRLTSVLPTLPNCCLKLVLFASEHILASEQLSYPQTRKDTIRSFSQEIPHPFVMICSSVFGEMSSEFTPFT